MDDDADRSTPESPEDDSSTQGPESPASREESAGESSDGERDSRRKGSRRTAGEESSPPEDPWAVGGEMGDDRAVEDTTTMPTRVDDEDLLAYTTDRRSLAAPVQIQWGFWMTVNVVVLSAILTAIVRYLDFDSRIGALFLVVFFLLGMAWVGMRYRRWVYQVQEDALYLERGVVTHVRTLVPYVRIQHVDTSRGPLERTLGLSTLVVYTAGSRGADVSIPGLTPEEASDLQQRVKELAIEAEGGDAL